MSMAEKALAALLAHHNFVEKLEGDATTILSFKSRKKKRELEADLGMFFRHPLSAAHQPVFCFRSTSHTAISNSRIWTGM